MTLDFKLAVGGNLRAAIARDQKLINDGTRGAVKAGTNALKADWRTEVRRGLSSRRAAGAIRSRTFEDRPAERAGIVFSNWRKRGADGQLIDPLAVHARGATIRPVNAKLLLIPARRTQKGRERARAAMDKLDSDPKIRLIPQKGGFVLVRDTPTRSHILAYLRRRTRLRKALDFDRHLAGAQRRLVDELDDALMRLERG